MTPLVAALAYAARGLRVLPIQPRAKTPIGDLVRHGVKDASSDAATITKWFAAVPDANVALAVPAEWRVLDVDPRNGGGDELVRLIRTHGPLPATIHARTGSGGEHMLYAFALGDYRGKIGPGLDLLGPGKYFLVAPSVHPCGGDYKWTSDKGKSIATAPPWLVDLARVPPPPAPRPFDVELSNKEERARRWLAKAEPAISGANGHTQTFLVARKLVLGFGLSEDEALFLMADEWNQRCKPPWAKHELAHKVRQAARARNLPTWRRSA